MKIPEERMCESTFECVLSLLSEICFAIFVTKSVKNLQHVYLESKPHESVSLNKVIPYPSGIYKINNSPLPFYSIIWAALKSA